nr:MAG TPA: hypothetical protein [Caudoviricetes sp.]
MLNRSGFPIWLGDGREWAHAHSLPNPLIRSPC